MVFGAKSHKECFHFLSTRIYTGHHSKWFLSLTFKVIANWIGEEKMSDLRLSLAEFLFSSSFWPGLSLQGSHSDEQHPTVLKICTCNNGPYHGMSSHATTKHTNQQRGYARQKLQVCKLNKPNLL